MKKLLIGLIILTISYALFAQEIGNSWGGKAGITIYNFNEDDGTDDYGWNIYNFIIGVYGDFKYIRIMADYEFSFRGEGYVDSAGADFSSVDIGFFNLTLLAKNPFDLGSITIWPALGLRYSLVLSYIIEGTDFLAYSDEDLSDYYLVGGVGIDFYFDELILTLQAFYDYNLTPNPSTIEASGYSFSGSDIEISITFGFGF
jgi:hypothetical protein